MMKVNRWYAQWMRLCKQPLMPCRRISSHFVNGRFCTNRALTPHFDAHERMGSQRAIAYLHINAPTRDIMAFADAQSLATGMGRGGRAWSSAA